MGSAAVALVAVWVAAVPIGAAEGGLDRFVGNWVRTERERDDAARDAVIVRATEPMSFAFRDFARGVMRKRMVPVERYVIEQDAGAARIRNDRGQEFPLDARAHVTEQGREVTSRLSETSEIEQVWKEGDSHGVTTWRIEDDGRLVVSQHVIDSHFEAPLEYSTAYRRAP